MNRYLLHAFAQEDPERFARLLGSSTDLSESVAILTEIPDGLEGDVVARLTPDAADRLLNSLPDEVVSGWLSACPTDVGRRLLAKTRPGRAAGLIAGIADRSKRRGLRRLVSYPPGSIGNRVQLNITSVTHTALANEVIAEIQQYGGNPHSPVAILNDDGAVIGALDLAAFLHNRDPAARAADFCIAVKPVFAEAPLVTLKARREWARLTSLPVVDHEQRLIGYVSRADLDDALGTIPDSSLVLDSGIELTKRFLEFLAYTLMLLLGRRTQP